MKSADEPTAGLPDLPTKVGKTYRHPNEEIYDTSDSLNDTKANLDFISRVPQGRVESKAALNKKLNLLQSQSDTESDYEEEEDIKEEIEIIKNMGRSSLPRLVKAKTEVGLRTKDDNVNLIKRWSSMNTFDSPQENPLKKWRESHVKRLEKSLVLMVVEDDEEEEEDEEVRPDNSSEDHITDPDSLIDEMDPSDEKVEFAEERPSEITFTSQKSNRKSFIRDIIDKTKQSLQESRIPKAKISFLGKSVSAPSKKTPLLQRLYNLSSVKPKSDLDQEVADLENIHKLFEDGERAEFDDISMKEIAKFHNKYTV